MPSTTKKGIQTSELWVGILGVGTTITTLAANATAINSTAVSCACIGLALMTSVYIWSRTQIKTGDDA